jgi:hypothetical protein
MQNFNQFPFVASGGGGNYKREISNHVIHDDHDLLSHVVELLIVILTLCIVTIVLGAKFGPLAKRAERHVVEI